MTDVRDAVLMSPQQRFEGWSRVYLTGAGRDGAHLIPIPQDMEMGEPEVGCKLSYLNKTVSNGVKKEKNLPFTLG